MSAKDEKHSLFATLWFTVAHYCIRPWPWIIVGLASLVLYPELGADEKRLGYVYAMRDYLPVGLKGLLVAAFFAAYMSTISTQLNWGTSYLMNDFYRRFLKPNESERHYVGVSRLATGFMMLASLGVTLIMTTISGAWAFIIEAGAGLGLVLILRWFWWRINAWSEISAMIAPFIAYGFVKWSTDVQFPESLFLIVAFTTVVWIVVTFVTKPTDVETLKKFFTRIHPGGWWKPVAELLPDVRQDSGYGKLIIDWIAGVLLVYNTLFGLGKLILGDYSTALMFFIVAGLAEAILIMHIMKIGWVKVAE
jgi:Na+/proline symporter